jgi:hypothetical protein
VKRHLSKELWHLQNYPVQTETIACIYKKSPELQETYSYTAMIFGVLALELRNMPNYAVTAHSRKAMPSAQLPDILTVSKGYENTNVHVENTY